MVGQGGLTDSQTLAQFADAELGTRFISAIGGLATIDQAREDGQAIRMREGFKGGGELLKIYTSKNVDI